MTSIAFDNSYARLPSHFFARLDPSPVPAPEVIRVNTQLAEDLGLDPSVLTADILAGNAVPDGANPIAMAYAGHQFGNFVPQLGDGRALLLGEVIGRDGLRYDIQLKGAGRTPFSRGGDGRAWLGPVLREYIVSEAMAALGVPTTRALAAVKTGAPVYREDALPGAVLTRVARAHIRVGSFQYFAARKDDDALRALADHAIARLAPELAESDNPYLGLLRHVSELQAQLIAKWMGLGFIHGVMNTDNMSIAGETIDYGPCAFMDTFHQDKVFSSIDQMGRYAYRNQPGIAQWNLANLAQCLLPLIDEDRANAVPLAQAIIDAFPERYETNWLNLFAAKLGLSSPLANDGQLVQDLLSAMAQNEVDFTCLFDALAQDDLEAARRLFNASRDFDTWAEGWMKRRAAQETPLAEQQALMRRTSPAIIPRNHRVEAAIEAAVAGDFTLFHRLAEALQTPFEDRADIADLKAPPSLGEHVTATFCGT